MTIKQKWKPLSPFNEIQFQNAMKFVRDKLLVIISVVFG
jgi:hypothetical protein